MQTDDECEVLSLRDEPITLDDICAAITAVHRQSLVTPIAGIGSVLWADAGRHWVAGNAERQVQMLLLAALAAAFRTCDIRPEQSMPEGRTDLEIERQRMDGLVERLAVLELKVLRSFGSSGNAHSDREALQTVRDGTNQAHAYATGKGIPLAVLCCFDMRSNDSQDGCFDQVREHALALAVHLRRWYLFATAKLFRDAIAARDA
jgi:hypothetical protein